MELKNPIFKNMHLKEEEKKLDKEGVFMKCIWCESYFNILLNLGRKANG